MTPAEKDGREFMWNDPETICLFNDKEIFTDSNKFYSIDDDGSGTYINPLNKNHHFFRGIGVVFIDPSILGVNKQEGWVEDIEADWKKNSQRFWPWRLRGVGETLTSVYDPNNYFTFDDEYRIN